MISSRHLSILVFGVLLLLFSGLVPLAAQETSAPPPAPAPGTGSDTVRTFQDPFATGSGTGQEAQIELSDPLEPWNRVMLNINQTGFKYVGEPLARAYRDFTPEPVRTGFKNFFSNLYEPTYTVNSLLQGEWHDASVASRRFVINSTFGLFGFFDPAGDHLDQVERDFDQTLGHWGVEPGFYLVWPIIGPSSPRGTVGYVVDESMDPMNYVGSFEEASVATTYRLIHDASYQIGQFETLEKFSVDQYAAIKDYYEKQLYRQSQK